MSLCTGIFVIVTVPITRKSFTDFFTSFRIPVCGACYLSASSMPEIIRENSWWRAVSGPHFRLSECRPGKDVHGSHYGRLARQISVARPIISGHNEANGYATRCAFGVGNCVLKNLLNHHNLPNYQAVSADNLQVGCVLASYPQDFLTHDS